MMASHTAEELERGKAFIESVPWRQVKGVPEGPLNKPPDPHEYVIEEWDAVHSPAFWQLVRLIQQAGYLARYAPPYDPSRVMTFRYLVIGGYRYWHVRPNQLCRVRADQDGHKPEPEQLRLEMNR